MREYLVGVTNQIFIYLSAAEAHPNDKEQDTNLVLAAALGCATFRRLHGDPQFREYVVKCTERYSVNQNHPMVEEIRQDYARLEEFMKQEIEVLIKAGVRLDAADEVTRTVLQMRKQYGPEVLKYKSPEEIFLLVEQHRDSACNTWKALQDHMAGMNKINAVRRIGLGLGGAALIAGNAAVDAGIIGLSFGMVPVPVLTQLSGAAGGALLGGPLSAMFTT